MDTPEGQRAATHRAYQITLRAPAGADAIRLLRAALKVLLRRFGLQCLKIEYLGGEGGE